MGIVNEGNLEEVRSGLRVAFSGVIKEASEKLGKPSMATQTIPKAPKVSGGTGAVKPTPVGPTNIVTGGTTVAVPK